MKKDRRKRNSRFQRNSPAVIAEDKFERCNDCDLGTVLCFMVSAFTAVECCNLIVHVCDESIVTYELYFNSSLFRFESYRILRVGVSRRTLTFNCAVQLFPNGNIVIYECYLNSIRFQACFSRISFIPNFAISKFTLAERSN